MIKRITLMKDNGINIKNIYLRNLQNNYAREAIFEEENNERVLRGNNDNFYNSKRRMKSPYSNQLQKSIKIVKYKGQVERKESSIIYEKSKEIESFKLIISPLSTEYSNKRFASEVVNDVSDFSSLTHFYFGKLKRKIIHKILLLY